MAPRRILHEIRLDKIAAVDRPCQEPALATIMKRAPELPDLADAAAVKKAVAGLSDQVEPALAKHLIARAEALGVTNALPDGFVAKHAPAGHAGSTTDNEGDTMSSAIKKALGLADTATDAEVATAIEKAAAASTAAAAELTMAKALATLSDGTRAHYVELEKADKEKAKDFLAMEEADRKKEVAKALAGDETITLEGQTISKRAVGDAVFAVMKGQAARLDAQAADIAKAKEERETAIYKAAATTDYAHLAGTVDERASVLKAVAGIKDENVRKAAEAIFKAAEATAKVAFSRAGVGAGSIEKRSAEDQLTTMAKELQKADPKLDFAKAYSQVLETPEGAALYDQSLSAPVQE